MKPIKEYNEGVNYEMSIPSKNVILLEICNKMKVDADGKFPINFHQSGIEAHLRKILEPYDHEFEIWYRVNIYVLVGYATIQFRSAEDMLAFNLKYRSTTYGFE